MSSEPQQLLDLEVVQREQRDTLAEVKKELSCFPASIAPGDLVDALDNHKIWRISRIISRDDKTAEVEFIGWAPNWNEKIAINALKIRPFRSETASDTSSPKQGYYKDGLRKLEQDLASTIEVLSQPDFLRVASCSDIINLCRFSLPTQLIEMVKINKPLDEQTLGLFTQALEIFGQLLVGLVQSIEGHMVEFLVCTNKEKLAYLKHKPSAVVFWFLDWVQTLELIAGLHVKKEGIVHLYETNMFKFKPDYPKMFIQVGSQCPYPAVANLLNSMASKNLLESLFNLILWTKKCKIKDEVGYLHLPPSVLTGALKLISIYSKSITADALVQKIQFKALETVKTWVYNYNTSFDAHFNEIDKVLQILRIYETLSRKATSPQVDPELDAIQICVKYLSCPIFERKYSAIGVLNRRVEEYHKATEKDKEKYRLNMLENGVLGTLYINGYHPEIARKSDELLAFLAPKLKVEIVRTLVSSAFQQSAEKGGVICSCLRKSLQALDIEFIKAVLEILTTEVPIDKMEPETIQLIIEIIKQSGEKTTRFYFISKSKDGNKVVEDSVLLLWQCLEARHNLAASVMKSVLEALEDNVSKSKGGKPRMIEQCITRLREKKCLTQYIILLQRLLDSLDTKAGFIGGSEYDKVLEKLYYSGVGTSGPLASLALDEFIARFNGTCEEEPAFNEDKIYFSRLQLILILVFKGKIKTDATTVFRKLLSFLLKADNQKNFERFKTIMSQKDFITVENSDIFFSAVNDLEVIEDKFLTERLFHLYELLFLRVNLKTGALEQTNNKRVTTQIAKQEKFQHLKHLWAFCLRRRLVGNIRDQFYRLLVECYFRSTRKYESSEANRAWIYFTNDVGDEVSSIRMQRPELKALYLGNLAGIWLRVIEISSGNLHVGPTTGEEVAVLVRTPVSIGASADIIKLPSNGTLNLLKQTITETKQLLDTEFNLLYNNKTLSSEDLDSVSLATAADYFTKKSTQYPLYFEVDVAPLQKEPAQTAYAVRRRTTYNLSNNELFKDFLESLDSDVSENIWNLLSKLPSNKDVKKEITDLPEKRNLRALMDFSRPRRVLYYLNVLNKTLLNSRDVSYARAFFASGQFEELAKILIVAEESADIFRAALPTVVRGIFPVMDYFLAVSKDRFVLPQAIQPAYFRAVLSVLKSLLEDQLGAQEQQVEAALTHFEHLLLDIDSVSLEDEKVVDWVSLYSRGLVLCKSPLVRKLFSETFVTTILNKDLPIPKFLAILTPLYTRVLKAVSSQLEQAVYYFRTAGKILKAAEPERQIELLSLVCFEEMWNVLFPTLLTSKDEFLVSSILRYLSATLISRKGLDNWIENNESVLIDLASICLIDQFGQQRSKPSCQSTDSRAAFFEFLRSLTDAEPKIHTAIYRYFLKLVPKGKWRKKLFKDWNISPGSEAETARASQYAGLVNLGSTCYMNSIFQQIFMIEEFRNFLIDAEFVAQENLDENVMFQFQVVMKGLRDAVRLTYNPKNFCQVFKNFDGSPINVIEQMDADEFFNNLMDKLETELRKSAQEISIKRTFGGQMVQEVISSECQHRSVVVSDFLTLSVEVKGVNSIMESLDRMVAGEVLEGENKYNCEVCQKKVKALKRDAVKKLPNRLIVVLKRFEFKYETMTKVKLNSYCEFPDKIDMRKYSQGYLNDDQSQNQLHDSYYNFNLRGVTIHRGTANSGHYYSIIKDHKSSKWIEFNDVYTREFPFENLAEIAFGQEAEIGNDSGLGHSGIKGTNAYMLFYEREQSYDEDYNKLPALLRGVKESQNHMQDVTTEKILADNFEYYLKLVFFEDNFIEFVLDKAEQLNADQLALKENEAVVQLTFSTFFFLMLRRKVKAKIPQIYTLLIFILKKAACFAIWFLKNISNQDFLDEFLVECPIIDMKYFVYGLISQAIDTALKPICLKEPDQLKIRSAAYPINTWQKIFAPGESIGIINGVELTATEPVVSKGELPNTHIDNAGTVNNSTKSEISTDLLDTQASKQELTIDSSSGTAQELLSLTVELSEPADAITAEATEILDIVKNFLLIVLKTIQANTAQVRFLGQLFRLVNDLSQYKNIRALMFQWQVPDLVANMLIPENPDAPQYHHPLPPSESQPSVFEGYIKIMKTDFRIMSIDDINWEKKGEARSRQDFKTNYSYLISAAFRTLLESKPYEGSVLETLFPSYWADYLNWCRTNESRRLVCNVIANHLKTVDDNTYQIFNQLLAHITEAFASPNGLDHNEMKNYLYFLKYMTVSLEEQQNRKSIIRIMNTIVSILDTAKSTYIDYIMSYLFRILSVSTICFDKLKKEDSKRFCEILLQKVDSYTEQVVYEAKRKYAAATAPTQGNTSNNTNWAALQEQQKSIELIAKYNRSQRHEQIKLIRDEKREEFKKTIVCDSDDEYQPTSSTKKLDLRDTVNANIYKTKKVKQNLGVMLELESMTESAFYWIHDDNPGLFPANTASLQYLYKLDNI